MWNIKQAMVAVYSDKERNYATYEKWIDQLEERCIELNDETYRQIQNLLYCLEIRELEEPCLTVDADGFHQEFIYDNGTETITLSGTNLEYCREEPGVYPNAVKMLEILSMIGEILVPLGVDSSCFLLSDPMEGNQVE